jgi:phage gpG-like protein
MAEIRLQIGLESRATMAIQRELLARLRSAPVGVRLVAQAKRRIRNGGDSTVKYPELWADNVPGSYRAGGRPLRDDGRLYSSLANEYQPVRAGARWALTSPLRHAVYQHRGFQTRGPNFIPLTKKAKRNWTHNRRIRRVGKAAGWPEIKIKEELAKHGLIEGETFIMAWGGVEVPARPIFNLPPEDRAEIRATVRRALRRRRA